MTRKLGWDQIIVKRVWFRALYLTNTIEMLLEPIILSVSTPSCISLQILKLFPAVTQKLDQKGVV